MTSVKFNSSLTEKVDRICQNKKNKKNLKKASQNPFLTVATFLDFCLIVSDNDFSFLEKNKMF